MAVKGDEFLKNVKDLQEENLRQKVNEFESIRSERRQSKAESLYNLRLDEDSEDEGVSFNSPQSNNKKKYFILGIALILLFLITIILVKFIMSDVTNFDKKEPTTISQEEVLNNEKIQQDYQQVVNENLNKNEQNKEDKKFELTEEINKVEQAKELKEIVTNEPEVETEQKSNAQTQKEEQYKKSLMPSKNNVNKNNQQPSFTKGNVYIQISSPSKMPPNDYFKSLEGKSLKYRVFETPVNGKLHFKILIGPYASRTEAQENLNKVRALTNTPSAYIMTPK